MTGNACDSTRRDGTPPRVLSPPRSRRSSTVPMLFLLAGVGWLAALGLYVVVVSIIRWMP